MTESPPDSPTESMHDYVVAQLQACKGKWPQVATDTEISLRTIQKIARRIVSDPGVSLVERLNRYFRAGGPQPALPTATANSLSRAAS